MAISFKLYNAPSDKADMNIWDKDYSLPIVLADSMMQSLQQLFYPRITGWRYHEYHHNNQNTIELYSALVKNNCDIEQEYIDIYLEKYKDGYIHILSIKKGSPIFIQHIIQAFNLDYVFDMDTSQLIDPYKYQGNWQLISL